MEISLLKWFAGSSRTVPPVESVPVLSSVVLVTVTGDYTLNQAISAARKKLRVIVGSSYSLNVDNFQINQIPAKDGVPVTITVYIRATKKVRRNA